MSTTADSLRAYVDRIERIHEERDALSQDLSDIYAEAASNGFDKKALKAVVAYRRKDRHQAQEQQALFETYLAAIEGRTALPPAKEGSASPHQVRSERVDPEPAPKETISTSAGEGADLDIPGFLRRELVDKVAEANA